MTSNKAEGLWALVMGRYAGNLHLIRHADDGLATSMKHRAELENTIIEGWALDHFGLAEALQQLRDFVERAADFPP